MDIRHISDVYAVSPQIAPKDCAAIADAGFTCIICNRPDAEIPASHHASPMADAARQAGLAFHALPLTHQTMTPENIEQHKALIEAANGPVLAYCASGTRSTIVWALGQAGQTPANEILSAAASAGYDLAGLRGALGS
ncbi:MAG: TIGR01244 family sulfur transferase [Pseudomonadota bacterium]